MITITSSRKPLQYHTAVFQCCSFVVLCIITPLKVNIRQEINVLICHSRLSFAVESLLCYALQQFHCLYIYKHRMYFCVFCLLSRSLCTGRNVGRNACFLLHGFREVNICMFFRFQTFRCRIFSVFCDPGSCVLEKKTFRGFPMFCLRVYCGDCSAVFDGKLFHSDTLVCDANLLLLNCSPNQQLGLVNIGVDLSPRLGGHSGQSTPHYCPPLIM